jgi:hypothetical protein
MAVARGVSTTVRYGLSAFLVYGDALHVGCFKKRVDMVDVSCSVSHSVSRGVYDISSSGYCSGSRIG